MARDKKTGNVDSGPPKPPRPNVLPLPAPGLGMDEDFEMEDDLDRGLPKLPERPPEGPGKPSGAPRSGLAPPLFVKVEKYEDVIKDIQELRSYALSLRDALDALADIEKELKVGMEIAHKALDRLNVIISSLDSKLLRTAGVNIEGEVRSPKEVEGYIKNVYSQIEKLKNELRSIK